MRTTIPLTCLALLFAATPVLGADRWFPGTAAPNPGALDHPVAFARAHLEDRSAELELSGIALDHAKTVTAGESRVVRFSQTVDGVPVVGASVVVRLGHDGSVGRIAVDVARDLVVDTVPALNVEEAHGALEHAVGDSVPVPERSKLVISRIDGGRLIWQLDVRDAPGGTRYWVDAHDGSFIAQFSLAVHAQGSVYAMNSVETPTPVDVELPLIDAVDPLKLNGWGGLLTVTNYVSGNSQEGFTLEQTLVPNSGSNFLYPPPADATDPTDGFAQVNLYYHLTTVRTLFQTLGADVDAASWKLTAVANAQEDGAALNNAFFSPMGQAGAFASPNLIAIGQGDVDFAYDSDVFKHEFGHYVSHNAVGYNLGQAHFDELGLSPFSGAIDEGIADYFACSHNDDAELGEASLELLGSGRDLTDTSAKCPNDMVGEVHFDGEIIGSFSWSLRIELGQDVADRLVWGAIATLPEGASFGDFAQGVLSSAEALVETGDLMAADITTIEGLLTERGLDDCGRIISIEAGETMTSTIFGLSLVGQLIGGDCAQAQQFGVAIPSLFHYSWTPAAGDVGLRFTTAMTALDGAPEYDYTIHARANDTVRFTNSGFLPEVSVFDHEQQSTTANGELVIDASSDPPFDPSATYDFVVVSRSCPTLQMEATAASFEPPVNEGGGGTGGTGEGGADEGGGGGSGGNPLADGDDEDGCGCRVAGRPNGDPTNVLLGLGALALIGAARRRRRG